MPEAKHSLLDPELLRILLAQIEATAIDELEVVHGSTRLYLRREPGGLVHLEAPVRSGAAVTRREGIPVTAPLTGVLYARPSPEAQPFVQVGDRVEPGQVVALIETMKLFNEVTTEIAGEIVSIEHQDGDLVEAGQVLVYVRVHSEDAKG